MTQPHKLKLTCLTCGTINAFPANRLAEGPKCSSCGDALADGTVAEISLAELEKATRHDSLPLLADLWAPWCGPCRMMAPEFASAAARMKTRARFVKLDTDRHADAAVRYAIRGIPALLLFEAGRERNRHAGAMRADQITTWVEQNID
ncbi:MAG: thioredoxin domain-containing protein [Paracoccaceae bacterium]